MPTGIYERTEEHKRCIRKSMEKKWQDLEYKKKMERRSEMMRGDGNPMRRPEVAMKLRGRSNGMYGRIYDEEERKNIGEKTKEGMKRSGASLKLSKVTRENWQDSEYRKSQVEAIMRGSAIKPNKTELELGDFLQRILLDEYKYVGDGEFILAGKCPDFVNINGQKKIIELFGDYWHKGDSGKDRIKLFKQYGYETLIVWEHELKDTVFLERKILEFNSE